MATKRRSEDTPVGRLTVSGLMSHLATAPIDESPQWPPDAFAVAA